MRRLRRALLHETTSHSRLFISIEPKREEHFLVRHLRQKEELLSEGLRGGDGRLLLEVSQAFLHFPFPVSQVLREVLQKLAAEKKGAKLHSSVKTVAG
jgi:hypothetical protein